MANIKGDSNDPNVAAVFGDSTGGPGVWGNHKFNNPNASGVYGTSAHGVGVWGKGGRLAGMFEGDVEVANGRVWAINTVNNPNASALLGTSQYGVGVWGKGKVTGTVGEGEIYGIYGRTINEGVSVRAGIFGESKDGYGVIGKSNNIAISAESTQNTALVATTRGRDVSALIVNQWGTGNIIIGRDNRNAEVFRVLNSGDVQVRGITLTCDKNEKENFLNVNSLEILDNLMNMSIQSWNYKTDPNNIRHIGPTAQDFQTAFGLNGDDDVHISGIDIQGVALAAIQGLNEKLKAENDELHTKIARLEERLSALESKV
ncbi:hypothetical protein CN675_08715 [Bacillus toyonensis]|uniref:tail fiber domain-containing protein n=1 Tax=Bacillus toyonensis TaxID=155322 RepID=UPI000BF0B42E|nr:tail fiber domain-containing protein [Bacillus toyonensis]PEJ20474.1 hypothetical protein CN675_08715 [Bacillus toyonensis]PEP08178.1 hypothetical protein CN577_11625 [Bacillus toyonensis]